MLAQPALGKACAPVVARAREHFAEADAIMARSPRRAVRAPRIMGAAYRLILERHDRARLAPPRAPVERQQARGSLWIILRYAII